MYSDTYRNKFSKIIEYLFVIFTILQNSVYYYQLNHNKIIIILSWQILIFIMFISVFITNKTINRKVFLFVSLFLPISLLVLILYYIYNPFTPYYFLLLSIDPSMLIVYFCSKFIHGAYNFSIFNKLENVMYALAIISLIGYIAYYLGMPPTVNTTIKWGTQGSMNCPGYFFIDFIPYTHYGFMGTSLLRNTGLFIEAPFYSYLLSISLFINLFFDNHRKIFNKKSIVFLITILLTFSTTGMILIVLSFPFAYLNANHSANNLKKSIIIIFVPIVLIFAKYIFNQKKNMYINSVNSSYNVRHDDILASLHAWSNHIIVGNGIGNTKAIYEYVNPLRLLPGGDAGITADLFGILAYGGIILALFYVIPTLLVMFISSSIRYFAIFTFIIFMFEGIMFSGCYIVILSFFYSCFLMKSNKIRIFESGGE